MKRYCLSGPSTWFEHFGPRSAQSSAKCALAGSGTAPAPPPAVTYAYDLADRLTSIVLPSGSATTFTIDALGRHASRTAGSAPTESYSYLGSTNTVIGISTSTTTTLGAIDAVGNRVATGSGGVVGFLLPDLHGNTAAALNSSATSITDAFAYDAYGNTVASVTSALPTPWRYQGRILESAPGTPDLYDFGPVATTRLSVPSRASTLSTAPHRTQLFSTAISMPTPTRLRSWTRTATRA
jgi:YD repeat-containing protein